jgi:GT2 family glycosyltransferase
MKQKKRNDVALIFVTCNQKEITAKTIDLLLKHQTIIPDIIIVDNFSNDGTKEKIKKDFPSVIVLKTKGNYGGSGGQYIGMRYAYEKGYEWIIMSDNDAIPVSENLIEELVKNASNNIVTQPWNNFGDSHNNDAFAMHYACYSKYIINKIKFPLFDFFLYGDDIEYSLRVKNNGFGIKKLKNTFYFHPTKRSFLPSRQYFYFRNFLNIFLFYNKFAKILLEGFVFINSAFAYKIIKERDLYIFGISGIKNFLENKNDNTYISKPSKIYSKIISSPLETFRKENHKAVVTVFDDSNKKLKMKNNYGKIKKMEWLMIFFKHRTVIVESINSCGLIFSAFLFGKKIIAIEDIDSKKVYFREYILPVSIKKIGLLFFYNFKNFCLTFDFLFKVIFNFTKRDDLYEINKKYDNRKVKDFYE